MRKIMLICSAGMSTSLLVTKMEAAAEEEGYESKIWACAEADAKSQYDEVDVILLGPQVRYLLNNVQKAVEGKDVKIGVIEMTNYGRMNGEAVLEQAMDLLGD